jgi:peptidoglycan/xylan/chitin deacetylase (PgdA/CDA1 family)
MLELIFTLDYELYGDGSGNLKDCLIKPTNRLLDVFNRFGYPLVIFPEVLELEEIDEFKVDNSISEVKQQLRTIFAQGHEIGLHVHSWWAASKFISYGWQLNYEEANLCRLPRSRIEEILNQGLNYLRNLLDDPYFQPVAFRNGFWIMQPTREMALVLNKMKIKIDSTLFKGGKIRKYGIDYCPSLNNGYYWKFLDDVNLPQYDGVVWEIPIFTEMVPVWRMFRRLIKNYKNQTYQKTEDYKDRSAKKKMRPIADYFRIRYPRKIDYCFLDSREIIGIIKKLIMIDQKNRDEYKPIVLIGHSKNLVFLERVEAILEFVKQNDLKIVTFKEALKKIDS